MYSNKTNYVAEGVMQFMTALINDNHADKKDVLTKVTALCNENLNLIQGTDPNRNK